MADLSSDELAQRNIKRCVNGHFSSSGLSFCPRCPPHYQPPKQRTERSRPAQWAYDAVNDGLLREEDFL